MSELPVKGTTTTVDDHELNYTNVPASFGWQVCPKCQGQGVVSFPIGWPYVNEFITDGTPCECDVCRGEKIIGILTGRPPKKE